MPTLPCVPFLAFVPFVLLSPTASAQLREPGLPASFRHPLPSEVPSVVLDAPADVPSLRAAAQSPESGRFRYGVELPVGLSLENSGRFDSVAETGELVWRLELDSPQAFSLGVFFERFVLPPGAQVFLYDPARREVLGAYGNSTESPNGMLAIQPLRGDRVVIEYVEPAGTSARPELVIGNVVHDYLDVFAHLALGQTIAVSCLVDVNCPQGAPYQVIKRAVVWMFGGGGGCSASILNNTAEDGTPYLMTAEHCGNQTNAVFVFDYERTGCGAGGSSQSKTLSGSQQLAVSSVYDGQLYRLNQAIPASYEPFFAGWSRSGSAGNKVVGISHPSGLPKKISIDNHAPFKAATRISVQWDVGAIQPGSSGSPLFDSRQRVIGSLSTGAGGCSVNGQYGRFDLFYSNRNLGQWLDPLGLGLSGIDGYDGIEPYAKSYVGSGVNPEILRSVSDPRLGTQWTAEVDTSAIPQASSTILAGYGRMDEGQQLFYGELLVDLASPLQFQSVAPVVAGLSTYSFALPGSIALAGRVSYTQAFALGGGITVATNGLKLVLQF